MQRWLFDFTKIVSNPGSTVARKNAEWAKKVLKVHMEGENQIVAVELEELVVADVLSGKNGTNRGAPGQCQLQADTDKEALIAFLRRYSDSPNTLANARREAERLLLWALWQMGKPLSSLTHEDMQQYKEFLKNPQPVERWVMPPGRKLGRQDPKWRPFAGPLSDSSVRQTVTVLNTMLGWLKDAGYLMHNPLALSKMKRKHAPPGVTRYLEEDVWEVVKETIKNMPQESPLQVATYRRTRWLFSLLFLGGLRISEVVGNTMGDFFMKSDATGQPSWRLNVLGKGEKQRIVTATDELMRELGEYRTGLGLTPRPVQGEGAPLLFPVKWKASGGIRVWPKPLTRSAVHQMVKEVFDAAAQRWLEAGGSEEQGARLKKASAHWLRHTAGSRLAAYKDVNLQQVRDTLGHSSLTTTSMYVHTEENERHAAVNSAHKISW